MISMSIQPSLSQLNSIINKVPFYPFTIQRLLKLAKDSGAPKDVINFYKAFPDDQVFDNEEDLAGRSEQIQIMRREEMPEEQLVAPEEY